MPSFLSSRQSSRSHHHQQQQQQQQQQSSPTLQQQPHPFGDPSTGSGASTLQDSGSASASTYSNADLQAFDSQRQQGQQGLDDQQFSSQQQQQQRIQQQQFQSLASGGPGLTKSSSTKLPSNASNPAGSGSTLAFDRLPHLNSKRSDLDYQEQVSRSQSQRYATQGQPQQSHQHYASSSLGAASVDDLSRIQITSPPLEPQEGQSAAQSQPAPVQPPVQEKSRTTRKLFKSLLGGGSSSKSNAAAAAAAAATASAAAAAAAASDANNRPNQQQQASQPPPASQNAHNNTAGLGRHPSKRLSQQQPPSLRTGHSQVSVLDPPAEWSAHQQQQQQQQYIGIDNTNQNTQPSPLQGLGEFSPNASGGYDVDQPPPPIRRVRTVDLGQDSSSYSTEDITRLSNSHLGQNPQQGAYIQQLQASSPTTYGQGHFDPSQQQQQQQQQQAYPALQYHQQAQAISTNSPHHAFIGHIGTAGVQQQQYNGHLQQQQQNPETLSQVSHESPGTDADQLAAGNTFAAQDQQFRGLQRDGQPAPPQHLQQSQGQLQVGQGQQQQVLQSQNQAQGLEFQDLNQQIHEQDQQNMAPQPSGPSSSRRSQDASEKAGPPPTYRHSQTNAGAGNLSPLPPLPQNAGGNAGSTPSQYRSTDQRQYEAIAEGRNSPQPTVVDQAVASDAEKQLKDLAVKYKNVKRLYFEGKSTIDQLNAQIEHLQNAIANQRMSQSRTVLDDSEYLTRFGRLNGAINNLSFNIRKDWEDLPPWIKPYTSKDALRTGKQEMTATGRAVISMWVMNQIFNDCFHPGLDPLLSSHLKEIEQNIRLSSSKMNSQEEHDTLTSKIINWRMSTLDGLQSVLNSAKSTDNQNDYIAQMGTALTDFLNRHFKDPKPVGVEGSVNTIVELAVGIAKNLPMESRDVAITFPMPGEHILPHLMEVEKAGLPSLETRPADDGGDPDANDGDPDDESGGRSAHPSNDMPLVRFAAFFAIEVRGRQVLNKAPVYTM